MINVKKLLSSLLAIAMISSFGTVMAEETGKADYVVTYQAEEITDMDVLLDMAVEQNRYLLNSRSLEPVTQLSVKQKTSVKIYSDGSKEEDFCITTLGISNEYGHFTDLRVIIGNGTTVNSTAEYGITVTGTIYYTARNNANTTPLEFKVNKVVSSVVSGGLVTPYPVSGNILLYFSLDTADTDYVYKEFYCQSTASHQSFNMNVSNSNYYQSYDAYVGITAQTTLLLSNGNEIIQNTFLTIDS